MQNLKEGKTGKRKSGEDNKLEQKKEEGTKWYDTRSLYRVWSGIISLLDKFFDTCKIKYGKEDSRYDLGKHTIYIKKSSNFNKLRLVSDVIKMIIYNLAPGTKHVKYKEDDYLMVSFNDIDQMAGRIGEKSYGHFSDTWIEHLEEKKQKQEDDDNAVNKKKPSKETLKHLYYDKNLTLKAIAKLADVTPQTVVNWMASYDLPTSKRDYVYISPQRLDELYYEQDFSLEEIGKILGVSDMTIHNKMKEYNMPRRDKVYTVPAFTNRVRAFKSSLRKKIRQNPYYVKAIEEVLEQAKEDIDLK